MSVPAPVQRVMEDAVGTAFPGAVVEIGSRHGALWEQAFGALTRESHAPPTQLDTVFDLASLTKVVATTSLLATAIDDGAIALADPVARWLPTWQGRDREHVSLDDLMTHCAGLTAYLPFYRDHRGRQEFERAICTLPLEYPPRAQSLYSDLGFMLLGFILADLYRAPLDSQFHALVARRGWGDLQYRPPGEWRHRTAPTEMDPWRGRLLIGDVHDENAWALGGVAGHAGLFGTAAAVGAFARDILRGFHGEATLMRPATLAQLVRPSRVTGSSRARGWDTMRPTSSCGRFMSPQAIGHTGFTGTSVWIDPTADRYVILLTNRVHPSRANEAIQSVRRAVHDAIMQEGMASTP